MHGRGSPLRMVGRAELRRGEVACSDSSAVTAVPMVPARWYRRQKWWRRVTPDRRRRRPGCESRQLSPAGAATLFRAAADSDSAPESCRRFDFIAAVRRWGGAELELELPRLRARFWPGRADSRSYGQVHCKGQMSLGMDVNTIVRMKHLAVMSGWPYEVHVDAWWRINWHPMCILVIPKFSCFPSFPKSWTVSMICLISYFWHHHYHNQGHHHYNYHHNHHNPPPAGGGGSDPTGPPPRFFRNNFFIYYCIDMKLGTPLRASIWRRLVQRKSKSAGNFLL